jgi:conjugal transfer ATP-binding protein TraC
MSANFAGMAEPGPISAAAGFIGRLFGGAGSPHEDPRDSAQFATYLPYRACDTENDIFVLQHGLGFVLEVTPQTGSTDSDEKLLAALYRGWPVGTAIQVQLFGSPHYDDLLLEYCRMRKADPSAEERAAERGRPVRNDNMERAMARRRFDYLKKAAFRSITRGSPWLLRRLRLIVSISVPCNTQSPSALTDIIMKRTQTQATLRSAQFSSRVWNAEGLIAFTRTLTNPHLLFDGEQAINYDSGRDLRDQIVDIDTRQLATSRCLEFTRSSSEEIIEARYYAVRNYPQRMAMYGMGKLIGAMMDGTLQYPCPYLITLGAIIQDPSQMSAWVRANQMRATQNSSSKIAKYSPDIGEKAKDWNAALEALDHGDDFVKLYHTLALFAKPEAMRHAEPVAESIWRDAGFTINNVTFIHRPALLASLPLSLSAELEKDLYQLRISSSKPVAASVALSPMLGEWQGTKKPVMIFAGRRGQPCSFDFYDSSENYNCAIIGNSGSGKSFTIAEIINAYLGIGAKIWTLDLGRTFEKLCKKRKGEHLEFTSTCGININPFTHVVDFTDDYAMLQAVVAKMASPLGPMTDAFQFQALGEAIKQMWEIHGSKTTVTRIRDCLALGRLRAEDPIDQRLTDLAIMLSPYSTGGPYEAFFEGPSTVDFDNDLTVIEFEELKRSPALHKITIMILLFRITSQMYFSRDRPKLFIVDELKQQLGTGQLKDELLEMILDEAARRARKYYGALITATQEGADYFDNPSLRTSFTLASHQIILKQSSASIDMLRDEKKLSIDDGRAQLLKSIRKEDGAYSEMMLFTPEHSALVRLPIDPHAALLYSNRPQDNVPLDEKLAKGLTIDEAIAELIAERGGYA